LEKGFKILVFNPFGLHQPKAEWNPNECWGVNYFGRGRPKRLLFGDKLFAKQKHGITIVLFSFGGDV